jgi:hypothetical protein
MASVTLTLLGLLIKAGFLVCVPMLEEWRSGDGIEVLDGWTFQVYVLFIDLILDLIYIVYSVLIRVSAHNSLK